MMGVRRNISTANITNKPPARAELLGFPALTTPVVIIVLQISRPPE
jgi:hypothetical protein